MNDKPGTFFLRDSKYDKNVECGIYNEIKTLCYNMVISNVAVLLICHNDSDTESE